MTIFDIWGLIAAMLLLLLWFGALPALAALRSGRDGSAVEAAFCCLAALAVILSPLLFVQ